MILIYSSIEAVIPINPGRTYEPFPLIERSTCLKNWELSGTSGVHQGSEGIAEGCSEKLSCL